MKPMISIIIPVYNAGNNFVKTLDSIKAQTLKNIEVIIINDGSIDNTKQVIENYIKNDNRFLLINIKNLGVSEARNIGISNARGKYIAFVDADDYIDNRMYEKMYLNIIENESDMCLCSYYEDYNIKKKLIKLPWNTGTILNKKRINEELIPSLILIKKSDLIKEQIMGSVWRMLVSRDLIINNKILFNKNIKIAEDLIFCIDLFSIVNEVSILQEGLYYYVRGNNSTLEKFRKNEFEESIQFNKCLVNTLKKNNKYEANREICNISRLKNYTYSISNICKVNGPSWKEKRILLKKVRKYYINDFQIKKSYFSELDNGRKITYKLLSMNLISLIIIIYSLKEKLRVRKHIVRNEK